MKIFNQKQEQFAIIGIGCRFPGKVNNTDEFWNLLKDGRDGIVEIPKDRWNKRLFYHPDKNRTGKIYTPKGGFLDNIDKFDPGFFRISPREATFMDPQQKLLLEVTWEALEDGGINPYNLAGSKTGVFIGLFMHDYENIHAQPSERKVKGPHSATGISTAIAANRISYIYDLRGPSMVIDTACSSSLIAIHLACQSLLNKESEVALAGGVNIITNPEGAMSLCTASMLSPDGYSKAFDAQANGYARAEGVGIIVLKCLSDAFADNDPIYAIIRSSSTNQDGKSDGQTIPSSKAQQIVIKEALQKAGLKPKDIQYVEAHGTGTPVGDPKEAKAIGTVLSEGHTDKNFCPIGSVKTNIGHTESTAGVASVIKVVLMLKNKQFAPTLHFKSPNPNIPFADLHLKVQTSLEDWVIEDSKTRIACINSFGFGGSNACIILEEADSIAIPHEKALNIQNNKDENIIIPLSGNTKDALRAVASSYVNFLNSTNCNLSDLGYSSAIRKGHHSQRLTIATNSKDDFKDCIEAFLNGQKRIGMANGNTDVADSQKLVFVFSGMGQQWWAMGRELLKKEIAFKESIEKCDKLFKKYSQEWSLLEELTKNEEISRINETQIAQPCIFALQVGLNALWRFYGIIPDSIVGHSVGEVAAAYAAGALSLEDAVKVCFHRSRLQQTTAGKGKMLAVGLSVQKTKDIISLYENKISIAAINSCESVTLAGDIEALKDIASILETEKIFARFLKVEVPYHSPVMDIILPELRISLQDIQPQQCLIPFISTVTGKTINGEALNNEYWCQNARETVNFQQAVDTLIQINHKIFVEIGAHPVLAMSIRECLEYNKQEGIILPSLRRKETEQIVFLNSIGKLYCIGYPIDWKLIYKGDDEKFIKLPSYPWQKERYWNESEESKKSRIGLKNENEIHPLLGEQIEAPVTTWNNEIDLYWIPYLRDHVVQDSIVYPGAAYLEMGIAAVKEKFGNVPYELNDVVIQSPLLLSDNYSVQLELLMNDDDTFSIYSKMTEWIKHLTGKFGTIEKKLFSKKIDINEIKKRCKKKVGKNESYKKFHSMGLQYGKEFQLAEHLWLGESEALAEIKTSKTIQAELGNYWFHPAMLDVCFQSLASMPIDGTYLPSKIDSIKYFAPPSAQIYSYSQVVEQKSNKIIGNIQVFDKKGEILVSIQGLHCQYVEGTRKINRDSIEDILYEYQWVLQPHEDEKKDRDCNEYFPSPKMIHKQVQKNIPSLINQHERKKYYTVIEPKLNALCTEYIVAALRELEFKFETGQSFSAENLAKKLGITEHHHRFFNHLLEILEQDNILKRKNDRWNIITNPNETKPQKLWNEILLEHSDQISELILIERCGSKLSKILRSEENGLDLIFSPESLVTEHLYRNAPTFRIYNILVQHVMAEILDNLSEGQTLRILEIGAGTGSLSSYVLPLLPEYRVKYVFSDITKGFIEKAEKKFKDYHFVDYKILDIEKKPIDQGFVPHSFDLILASDAIHATSNLDNTLDNIKNLLSDNGILVLLEATKAIRWFDLVFGTLKGWWLFSDLDLRPNHALLSKNKWFKIFGKNGFSKFIELSDDINEYEPLHNILIAQGPNFQKQNFCVELKQNKLSENDKKRQWVILLDKKGIGETLSNQLQTIGILPTTVKKANAFQRLSIDKFEVCPSQADFEKLMKQIGDNADSSPIFINLWNIDHTTFDNNITSDTLKKVSNESCAEILYLVQVLAKKEWTIMPSLIIITNGTQKIGGIKNLKLTQAPLLGMRRVLNSEYPDWDTKIIDLSPSPSNEEILLLCQELLIKNKEDEITLRDRKRYVHRLIKRKEFNSVVSPKKHFSLYKNPTKSLKGFIFKEVGQNEIGVGEIELQVKAVGLNYRDIAISTNLLDSNLTNDGLISNLGVECSGVVSAIGNDVKGFKIGDEVMGLVANGFANYTTVNPKFLVHKPSHFSFEDAANVMVPFLTAYYALHNIGRIKKGETVLIHSATDDVGLAAIQISRSIGAKILVTGETVEKRWLLRSMGLEYIGDSTSLNFYEEIMDHTNGNKIDIVLNTLLDKGMVKSIQLLKPGTGRFIDLLITKQLLDLKDTYNNRILPSNIANKAYTHYFLNIEQIIETSPDIIADILKTIFGNFNNKTFYPISHRVFPLTDIANAFNCMQNENRIGKIVVSLQEQESGVVITHNNKKIDVHESGTYLITGGLGGYGLTVAKWLINCGAKHIVLLGRSKIDKPEAKEAIQELCKMGAKVLVEKVDVTKENQVKNILSIIDRTLPPLRGIIHAAMVLDDITLDKMNFMHLEKVLNPKILGAWNLHIHTLNKNLDFFINFSSFASISGNAGQANYAAGNAFLDSLSYYRQNKGLPSLTICWGAIGEVGYVAEHTEIKEYFQRQGISDLTLNQTWNVISYGIEKKIKQIGAIPIDWKMFSKYMPMLNILPRFSELFKNNYKTSSNEIVPGKIQKFNWSDSSEKLTEVLIESISECLGVASSKLDIKRTLETYGLDSLIAVELNVQIKERIGINLPKMILLQKDLNIIQLIEIIKEELNKKDI